MFLVEIKKEYKPHYITLLIAYSIMIVACFSSIIIFPMAIITKEAEGIIDIIIFVYLTVGGAYFFLYAIKKLKLQYSLQHTKYSFEAERINIIKDKLNEDIVSIQDIDYYQIGYQTEIYRTIYSDSVTIVTTDNKKMLIYKDFHTNYKEVIAWLEKNGVVLKEHSCNS